MQETQCVSSLQVTGFAGSNNRSTLLTVQGMTAWSCLTALMCLILLFLPNTTVPSPSVSISHDGGTESLYSGTSLTLTSVVTASNAVDILKFVNSTWSKDGSPLPAQTRAVVTPFLEFSNSNFPSCLLSTSVHLTMQLTVEYTAAQWHCLLSELYRGLINQPVH